MSGTCKVTTWALESVAGSFAVRQPLPRATPASTMLLATNVFIMTRILSKPEGDLPRSSARYICPVVKNQVQIPIIKNSDVQATIIAVRVRMPRTYST